MAVPTAIACRGGCVGRNWRAECRGSRRIHWRRFATTIQRPGVFTAPTPLPDDAATLQQVLRAALAEIERLQLQIAGLQRNRFGRRSERLDEACSSRGPKTWSSPWPSRRRSWKRCKHPWTSRPRMPRRDHAAASWFSATAERCQPHLPRIEVMVDVKNRACPCCGGVLHVIGEDRAEMLDYLPAQLRVRVIRRPRYGCRACEQAVVQAPALQRPIDGGMATEALLAHVLVSKYSDQLPLYRQSQIFARQGVTLDRSTLCNWVGRACWWLAPLHELMLSTVLSSPRVFADDTTLPVLDPGAGAPRPDGCGATPSTTALGRGQVIRPPPISTVRTARRSIRRSI